MINAIAFTLFGDDPKYHVGFLRNLDLARKWYSGWTVYLWTSHVDLGFKIRTVTKGAVIRYREGGCKHWRLEVIFEPGVDLFLIRDCDSRICQREALAVREWMASGLDFHVMRDHPDHATPIMAGMWGGRAKALPEFEELYRELAPAGVFSDQVWLREKIWPIIKDRTLQHDSCTRDLFPHSKPFPTGLRWGDVRFVGEVFDANDEPRPWDWQQRIPFMDQPG